MNKPSQPASPAADAGARPLAARVRRGIGTERAITNRSASPIKPLYTPRDWNGERFADDSASPAKPA